MSFDNILIIGCGLIGSSIARAAKTYGDVAQVYISDQSETVCATVQSLGFADGVAEGSAHHYAAQADMIILCVPPARMREVAADIIPSMKAGAILTDVGSVKGSIIKNITPHLRDDIHFIAGHPIAGTEYSGPEAGFADLFKDRWHVLTPSDETVNETALEALTQFWQSLGAKVTIMTPERHDIVLATTSHVPHLIAYTLVGTAVDMETVTQNEVVKFSAGGFRDFTRIAASDPIMWRDVFLANREATLEVVDRFIEDLTALKRAIRWDDGEQLLEHFSKTRDVRRRIVDAGQDSSEANFGRDDN
ncbi:MAG: prephenate/arogenate dehydrogenase family protein [Litorimonas sp.]